MVSTTMYYRDVLVILLVGVLVKHSDGYSKGAPDSACKSQIPGHSVKGQLSQAPYTVTPSAPGVDSGGRISVTLNTTRADETFKGFLVQARSSDDDVIRGTFFTTTYSYLTCGKGFNNAVTHNSPDRKVSVTLQWEAPGDFEGDVYFKTTFVKVYDTFWTGVTSEKVTVVKREAVTKASIPAIPTVRPVIPVPVTAVQPKVPGVPLTIPPVRDVGVDQASSPSGNVGDVVINVVDAPSVLAPFPPHGISLPTLISSGTFSPHLNSTTSLPPTSTSITIPSTSQFIPIDNSIVSVVGDQISSSISSSSSTTPRKVSTTTFSTPTTRCFGIFKCRSTTRRTPTSTTSTTTQSINDDIEVPVESTGSFARGLSTIYLGCGSNKGCFGIPNGCADKENCQAMMSYTRTSSGDYQFELMGSTQGYVAGALSEDNKMGSDSVMICRMYSGEVQVRMGWNEGKNNLLLVEDQYGLSNIEVGYVDGKVFCRFIRDKNTEINNFKFDLDNQEFHVLVAHGPLRENGDLVYHSKRSSSAKPLFLSSFAAVAGKNEMFRTLHACFMIGAWVCAASCGILIARYYKTTWMQSKSCNVDQWFHWHRFFMILTWSLTIAGFVLMAIYLEGWVSTNPMDHPHAVIGIISVGFCFIQPFFAMCRPGPGTKNRPMFNWMHWGIGNSAQILAICAMFYGFDEYGLPKWTWWILIGFIAFHCFIHLSLSIGQCVSDSKSQKRANIYPMKDLPSSRDPLQPTEVKRTDAPGGGFRKSILALYFLINWLVTAVLIIIVVFGEDEIMEWIDTIQDYFGSDS